MNPLMYFEGAENWTSLSTGDVTHAINDTKIDP